MDDPNPGEHKDVGPGLRDQTRSQSETEASAGILPSHGISIKYPPTVQDHHLHPVRHMSAPAYQSPIRHHRRAPSKSKTVKETLNARSHYGSGDDDGTSVHRINQYVIKQEIGRGSFGAVHLAIDQFGQEFAIKEFSKSRLRKRAQSNLLRQPHQNRRTGHLAAGVGFNSPLHRLSSSDRLQKQAENNSLDLIKEEIAIMKKLDHNNLVALIEVLDDPEEDSLYMVLEMCKKGVVMKVGLEECAEPYEEEACRCWFRDMVLGMEYLHAQGIIHRDIKPDNCLITDDDVLKIVDFGVSEMFEKESDMATAKSAGSPAFMPPELCVAKHGQVSGRAADIWSMGVTLYCLRYGHIPFEKTGMLELYDSIRNDPLPLDGEKEKSFEHMMRRLLEKNPEKRITMDELREHPWLTKDGTDKLLPKEENCAALVEPPTELEMNHAITGNMGHLLIVMRAVKRFKKLLRRKRPSAMEGFFSRDSRVVSPPQSLQAMQSPHDSRGARSADASDRRPLESILTAEGIHRDIKIDDDLQTLPTGMHRKAVVSPDAQRENDSSASQPDPKPVSRKDTHQDHPVSHPDDHRSLRNTRAFTFPAVDHAKGHAHDPTRDTLFLYIGPSGDPGRPTPQIDTSMPIVSESPPAVEMNIYEQAYQDQMKLIMERERSAPMFLNRRVEHRDDLRSHSNILDHSKDTAVRVGNRMADKLGTKSGGLGGSLPALVKMAKDHQANVENSDQGTPANGEKLSSPNQEDDQPPNVHPANEEKPSPSSQDDDYLSNAHHASLDPRNVESLAMPGGFPTTPGLESST